ncbi:hypothetical protein [Brevibacillus sp. H7]|uniref:hypothetical protein n=1 Tax=Brevibacillus sp. H7 TaxID=3349138 RepID=UPI003812D591
MSKMTANEYTIGVTGITNRHNLKSSPPGEVITYYLSEEERLQLIEKYGPILRKKAQRTMLKKTVEPQITREQYLAYKRQGIRDDELLKLRIPGLTCQKLVRLKTRWGLHEKNAVRKELAGK